MPSQVGPTSLLRGLELHCHQQQPTICASGGHSCKIASRCSIFELAAGVVGVRSCSGSMGPAILALGLPSLGSPREAKMLSDAVLGMCLSAVMTPIKGEFIQRPKVLAFEATEGNMQSHMAQAYDPKAKEWEEYCSYVFPSNCLATILDPVRVYFFCFTR